MNQKLLLLTAFITGFLACLAILAMFSGPTSKTMIDNYRTAVKKAHQTETIPAESEIEAKALNDWKVLISDLSADALKGKIQTVYAGQLYFNDTLKTYYTGKDVERHFIGTGEMIDYGKVKYLSETRDEKGDYYISWEMEYAGPKLNGGKPITTIGMSQLRFDSEGKVIFHQDFWDSTAGIFEHIPVLGCLIRYLRNRM